MNVGILSLTRVVALSWGFDFCFTMGRLLLQVCCMRIFKHACFDIVDMPRHERFRWKRKVT